MKQAGHQVTGLNLNHHEGSVEDLVRAKVLEVDPDACASGTLAPYLSALKEIFSAAREAKPEIVNVSGGGFVSGEPEMSLAVLDIDVGVISEGEQTIVELLDCLERAEDLHAVNGIVFRDQNGNTVETKSREQIRDLGQLPWPDYELLECEKIVSNQNPFDGYFFHTQRESRPRGIDMITSRSCPYSCTFCFHPVGKVYRERPLDDFFAELDMVVERYQVNMVALVDELFSLKRQRLLEFCERIKPYDLQWMVQLHVSSVDETTLTAMREAGCSYISYGIESMSLPILRSMKKKTKPERLDSVLALTHEHRIGIQGNLLFGDQAETLETANESMHWWAHNRHYQINLSPLVVFPGSPDYYEALKDGMIEDRTSFVRDIPLDFNMSRINDANMEMIRFQINVFSGTLLNLAQLRSFKPSETQLPGRGSAYDIEWICPRCDHQNDYRGVVAPRRGRSLRLTCRECLARWDVENRAHHRSKNDPVRPWQRRLAEARRLADRLVKRGRAMRHRIIGITQGEFIRVARGLKRRPFDPDRHRDFADVLVQVGAHGAARMHCQQALVLNPGDARARARLSYIDGPSVSDAPRGTYFVSWSDAPPPERKERPMAAQVASGA
jgi:radical SAM superfamily enzyme YgiQ (UPF0313 family)